MRLIFLIFATLPLWGQTVVGLPNSNGGNGSSSSSSGGGVPYCAPASASGAAYICAPTPALTSYTAGTALDFVPDVACTGGATTVNVNSLGAKAVKIGGGNPVANSCLASTHYLLVYDGTNFNITSTLIQSAYQSVTFVAGGMTFVNTGETIQGFTYTMTANMTGASTFSPALSAGQIVYLKPCQDGPGGRTNVYPAIVTGAGPVTPNGGFCTTQAFQYDGANLNPLSGAVTNDTNGVIGNIDLQLGYRYGCTHGSNATCGVSTLSSGTVTVSTTAIGALAAAGGAGYAVTLTLQSCSACGALSVGSVVNGTSFVINSTSGTDASKVYWEIRHVN